MPLRVAVVAEYYPRPAEPALGIWAHRQARAARERGVDVRVVALERPLPSLAVAKALVPAAGRPDIAPLRAWAGRVWDPPRDAALDGVPVHYARFVSPPRPLSYASWGRWAAPSVRRALDRAWTDGAPDLVHAHYAVPAGDAALRWMARGGRRVPLVVSVHGGDLSYAAARSTRGRETVVRVLRAAVAVVANSELTRLGIEQLTGPLASLEVIHPGADPPRTDEGKHSAITLVTVANLEAHKSQASVIRALSALRERRPELRYVLVGKGPDRPELEALARALGVDDRVDFRGALAHDEAMAELARCHLHVMPSVHDAFGVAHVEAMAAGLPAIGGKGTGAEDIAAAGEGMVLVPAGDLGSLTRAIDRLAGDDAERARLGEAARSTASERFSWARNGDATVALYRRLTGRTP